MKDYLAVVLVFASLHLFVEDVDVHSIYFLGQRVAPIVFYGRAISGSASTLRWYAGVYYYATSVLSEKDSHAKLI